MNKKQKFFIFYLVSFLGAIILFNAITIYGETKIQAAPKIGGDYSLSTTLSCLQDKNLTLKIDQSGLYLLADLLLQDQKEINLPMSGTMSHENISLSTKEAPKIKQLLTNCPQSVATGDSLELQGTLENNNIFGKITVNGQESGIDFTAKKQESKTPPTQNAH